MKIKYIDTDKLIAEIKRIYNEDYEFLPSDLFESVQNFKDDLLMALNTLEVEEVDLEKEIEEHADSMPMCEFTHDSEVEDYLDWARKEFRHFYELGLNTRKERTNLQ